MILNLENHPSLLKLAALYAQLATYFSALKVAVLSDRKGWKICGCVLLITIVRSGITYSFGMFVVQLESLFHASLAEQNWIGTLSFCISLSMAPISVAFIRMLRHRGYWLGGIIGTIILSSSCMASSFVPSLEWMFLTHSLLYGVGSSLIYMASSLVIGEYFDNNHRYHVLATSILLCGYPVGSLVFNPINAWLVTEFRWRVAFRVASVLILISGLGCCWTFTVKDTPNMERLEEEDDDEEKVEKPPTPKIATPVEVTKHSWEDELPRRCCTLAEVKQRPEIVLWYLGNLLSYLGFFMPFLNLAYYMNRRGYSPIESSWALTLLSLAECVTYIVASFLGDSLKGKLIYINVIASAALSVICIIWPFVDINYSLICVIAMAMGGFLGLTIVYTYAASGEVTNLPIDIAWSFTNLWSGVGILMGPFFSGAIFDFRQSYDDVFFVVGALYVLDAFIFAAIPGLEKWREYRGQKGMYNDIGGNQEQTQTVKVPQRSVSKNSLVNETEGVIEYGATADTEARMGGYNAQNGFAGHTVDPYSSDHSSQNPHNPFNRQKSSNDPWVPSNEQSTLHRSNQHSYGSQSESAGFGGSHPLQQHPYSRELH